MVMSGKGTAKLIISVYETNAVSPAQPPVSGQNILQFICFKIHNNLMVTCKGEQNQIDPLQTTKLEQYNKRCSQNYCYCIG